MLTDYFSIYFHIIISTKELRPLIARSWRHLFYAYVGTTVRRLGATPEAIGGSGDQLHLLVGLRPNDRLSDLVREIRFASTQWIHEEIGRFDFRWQEGYGAFSVCQSHIEAVKRYIASKQEQPGEPAVTQLTALPGSYLKRDSTGKLTTYLRS